MAAGSANTSQGAAEEGVNSNQFFWGGRRLRQHPLNNGRTNGERGRGAPPARDASGGTARTSARYHGHSHTREWKHGKQTVAVSDVEATTTFVAALLWAASCTRRDVRSDIDAASATGVEAHIMCDSANSHLM